MGRKATKGRGRRRVLALVVGAMLGAGSWAAACAAVDYTQFVRWAGGRELGGPVVGLGIETGMVYAVADGALQVINAQVPEYPVVMGSVPLANAGARVVAVVDRHVYLEDPAALSIIDVRQEIQPAPVGFLNLPGPGGEPGVVRGNYLYLARGAAGLLIIDVSFPSTPFLSNILLAGQSVSDVALAGDLLVVRSGGQTVRVYDLGAPTVPLLLGQTTLPGTAGALDADSDLLAVVNEQNDRVHLFDLSDPQAIGQVGTLALPRRPTSLELQGERLAVALSEPDFGFELLLVDLHLPAAPVVIGGAGVPGSAALIRLAADRIVVGGSGGASVVSLESGSSPPLVGGYTGVFQTAQSFDLVGTRGVFLEGPLGAVHILDLSNPAAPVRIGGLNTSTSNSDLSLLGNLLGIAIQLGGVEFWDITTAAAPILRSRFDTPRAHRVLLSGTRAYVADETGLLILDLSTPAAPTLLGSLPTTDPCLDLVLAGNLLYLAAEASGLLVVDVSAPTAPLLLQTIDTPGLARGVDRSGALLTVADDEAGLRLFNVANPTAPSLITVVSVPGAPADCAIVGSVVYVIDDASTFAVDVTAPLVPFVAGCALPWGAVDILARDGSLYLAAPAVGLRIAPQHLPPAASLYLPEIDRSWQYELTIAPNPSAGRFAVGWSRPLPRPTILRLFDVAGRLVLSRQVDDPTGEGIDLIEGARLSQGCYRVVLASPGSLGVGSVRIVR